jgi:hypothetical protein
MSRRLALYAFAVLGPALTSVAQVEVGDRAPDFEIEWVNFDAGDSLADLRGRVVLIEFWRTW